MLTLHIVRLLGRKKEINLLDWKKPLIVRGAQINVIRRVLFPEWTLQTAKKPLMLTLADGQSFWGGDKELVTDLYLGRDIKKNVAPWRTKA